RQKLLARLTGALAGLTLALAALGFYGVMSYRVARRRAEIGIRMAMGATRWQVQKLILQQTSVLLLAGVAPGLALTGAATRIGRSLLVGTAGANWEVIGIAVLTLAAVGLAAALVPARRAASVDPTQVLRAE
ncbi:MAG TPA: FtsX-like permease family protein, partial [Acidobacteriaceae bacterium]|nr:FtsX-like permease family protein [Acidobacteriaceae bacterium]